MYASFIKRILDLFISFFLLLFLSPFLLATALVLGFHFRANPFFTQKRIGLLDTTFLIIKFKTMRDIDDVDPDKDRSTTLGRWLRLTRWDETPQLWNILKGEMSLIGPRPLLPEYLPLYAPNVRNRHLIKPGIMGLAQLYGASALSWNRRFKLDLIYVDRISFLLDLWILFRSIAFLLRNETENNIGPYTGPE